MTKYPSDQDQIENYDVIGNLPVAWLREARILLACSANLAKDCSFLKDTFGADSVAAVHSAELETFGVVQMLRGMALECLLKGLWLKAGGTLASDGLYRKIPETRDHDLVSIAKIVSRKSHLEITDPEVDLLRRLSVAIFSGRYPIQKNWETTKRKHLPSGEFHSGLLWRVPSDEATYVKLTDKLQEAFG